MQPLQTLLPPLRPAPLETTVAPLPVVLDSSPPPRAKAAAGRSGSLISAKSNASDAAPADLAARHAAIEKLLALFYAAYDREPPEPLERKLKVGVWATALALVPVAELLPLAKRELTERESPFFPVPADLVRRWHARLRLTPEGAANVAAYLPYSPMPPRPALPEALPPLQIEPEELKRRLGFVAPRTGSSPPPESALPEAGERWSALLLDVARAGNIELERCSPLQIADLRAFGRWWLATYPTHELSSANFVSAYTTFSALKTDHLNTENTEEHKKHRG